MEDIINNFARINKIREKIKNTPETEIYVAKQDPEYVGQRKDIIEQLISLGFNDDKKITQIINDPECIDVESAINLYLNIPE